MANLVLLCALIGPQGQGTQQKTCSTQKEQDYVENL